MKAFFRIWFLGFFRPGEYTRLLEASTAPHTGLYAAALRAALDALLIYLPLSLSGAVPSTPSYLTFIPTASYYTASLWLMPLYLIFSWLLLSALLFVVLCLAGKSGGMKGEMAQILNITGMAGLVVGTMLIAWDWVWIVNGWDNVVLLGVSHLVFDIWAIVLTVMGFRRILGLSMGFSILLNVIWIGAGLPLAMLFARAPV